MDARAVIVFYEPGYRASWPPGHRLRAGPAPGMRGWAVI